MNTLVHRFVDHVPEDLENGVLYVSIPFSTVIHKCCCGCGHEVVTPLSRKTGWQLTFDGESISLHPSIGNRALPCRSHYWIERNKVVWARWPDESKASKAHTGRVSKVRPASIRDDMSAAAPSAHEQAASTRSLRRQLRRWFFRS